MCLFYQLPVEVERMLILICSVTSYSTAAGTLTLRDEAGGAAGVKVLVDVRLVLESLGAEQTRVGEWVNVIGYITAPPATPVVEPKACDSQAVHVQALILWSTGPLHIQQYRASAEALNA